VTIPPSLHTVLATEDFGGAIVAMGHLPTFRGSSHSSSHRTRPSGEPHRELGEVANFAELGEADQINAEDVSLEITGVRPTRVQAAARAT
jgi:hypothetical protein